MDMIRADKFKQLRMKIIGVADIDPDAKGYRHALEEGIFTTHDYTDFYQLKNLDLIIEVTGREEIANEIYKTKPEHVRLMGNVAARLFWDIYQIEEERILERRHAERTLREEGRFLRAVFNAIRDGMVVVDTELNIIQVNPWMEKLLDEKMFSVGKKCYQVFQNRAEPCEACPTVRTISTGQPHSDTIPYGFKANAKKWIDLSAFPLKNESGQLIGVIEYMRDITERKRAEADLRESEAQKRAILDASVDMIRYVDKNMKIIWANKKSLEQLGRNFKDIAGRSCYELFLGRDGPCEACPTKKALKTGKIERSIMQKPGFGGRQGETYWDCYGVPLKDATGEVVRLIQMARDVTEQRKAEKELERSHHELRAINAVLLRVTKEYNVEGMCRVLESMMRDFYPGFEIWIFLLNPQRDGFYFPLPQRVEVKGASYEKGQKRLYDLALEEALLQLLKGDKITPVFSGRNRHRCPDVIQKLVSDFSNWMVLPMDVDGHCHGLFVLGSSSVNLEMKRELVFVETVIRQVASVIQYQISKELRETAFREQLTGPEKFMGLVGRSQPMHKIYRMIQSVADSSSTVLITGESGTGKELIARAIHRTGKYKNTPFVVAHCSSFVPTLVHSEIFGHEKGAFTGAISKKKGRLERAQGGILFLDEVADLPLETQVLLLRFLQDKRFERVGGERLLEVNVRVIAATNKNFENEMKAGRLREDFFYRLNVLPIKMPPLRERMADIPLLANHFLKTYCLIEGKEIKGFDTDAMRLMMDYDWPGNVRELQNTVERCVVLTSGKHVGQDRLPDRIRTRAGATEYSLAKNERNLMLRVMKECNWNKHEAARQLDISRGTLYSKLKKHGIHPRLGG
jgi:PAS domain S-box-containing protein